jgi:hypothetical protein
MLTRADRRNSTPGVAAGTPVKIHTKSGSINNELSFEVVGDKIKMTPASEDKCVVHFSVSPSEWWKDVRYTCSTIQIFESEEEVVGWVYDRFPPT